MSHVEERLSAIAEMIAVELGSAPDEVQLWKELVRSVDVKRLDQTGEIVVRDVTGEMQPESAPSVASIRRKAPDRLHYNPSEVRAMLDKLRRRIRRSSAQATAVPDPVVPDVDEPNYDSAETELWLYGPLN